MGEEEVTNPDLNFFPNCYTECLGGCVWIFCVLFLLGGGWLNLLLYEIGVNPTLSVPVLGVFDNVSH